MLRTASEAIRELDAADMGDFMRAVSALRTHPVVQAIEPQNFPSIQRAVLFTVWELSEQAGIKYTDEIAKAFSAMLDIVDKTLCAFLHSPRSPSQPVRHDELNVLARARRRPELTPEERKKIAYFHRRAPGNTLGIESPEVLRRARDGGHNFAAQASAFGVYGGLSIQ